MSKPILLQDTFTGAYQDLPRNQLPKGKVWNTTDWIPDVGGGSLVKRSGWVRSLTAMSATSSSYAAACGYAPFSGAPLILGFDEDGLMYKWSANTTSITSVGSAYAPAHPPTFYRELAIICDPTGAAAPKKYNGSTLATLGGSPPNGAVSCVFKDRLILGSTSAKPNRVYFSNPADPETWDTTDPGGHWLDCSSPVRGLATLRNMLFVFEDGQVERIRGDIPPGVVGSDMVREPVFPTIGCSDPACIAVADDYVVFANAEGIYMSDGVGVVSLTEQCGMSSYWREKLLLYTSNYSIAGALWNGWYIFSVTQANATIVSGMIHIPTRRWVTLSNIKANMIAGQPSGVLASNYRRLFFAECAAARVSELDQIWRSIDDANLPSETDGDGTAVTGSVELPFYDGGTYGKKTWKNVYVSYSMGRGFSSSPTLTVSVQSTRINSVGYTALTPTISYNDTAYGQDAGADSRKRIPLTGVPTARQSLGLKISQTNSSLYTVLHAIEADVAQREGSRL